MRGKERGKERGKRKNVIRVYTKTIKGPKSHERDPAIGRTDKAPDPLNQQRIHFKRSGDHTEASILSMMNDNIPGDKIPLATPKEGKNERLQFMQGPAWRGGAKDATYEFCYSLWSFQY